MKSMICLFACVAFASAQVFFRDDGQWHPELDGSILGQWNPLIDNSLAGHPLIAHQRALIGHPLIHHLKKRAVIAPWHAGIINPNALNLPLDEITVAAAKNAQLISQHTEGTRNILGGGVPLALPADTPEVAAGKAAHAIAHERQKAVTAGVWAGRAVYPGYGGLIAPHGIVGARSWLW